MLPNILGKPTKLDGIDRDDLLIGKVGADVYFFGFKRR